jgi:zinc protease
MTKLFPRLAVTALVAGSAACSPGITAAPPAAPAGAPLSAEPPPPLADRPLEFPAFRETTLANGLPLLIVEHPGQPVASVSLFIRAGGAAVPPERAGLAGLTADLLTKGTTTRSAEEISRTIEGVGGSLSASATQDYMTISATVMSEHLPLALELVGDVTLRPTFPEDEFQLARRRTLSGLEAALGRPDAIAERAFMREVYGADHPYGILPVTGTVAEITLEDLRNFHRGHFGPENALLVIAGSVSAAEAEALALRHLGEWRAEAPGAPRFPEPPAATERRIHLVDGPGSVQSNIWVGHLGIRPDTPDFFAIQVMNQVLGGGWVSRLPQILRGERGWTYGAYSQFTRPRDIGYFAALTEVRTEVTDSAVAEVVWQLERLQQEPVPQAEFEAAVSFLAGSFPLRIETPGQIATQVALARLLGRPLEHVTEYRERIRAVTPEDVQRAARDYIRPDQAAIIIVGDAAAILPGLQRIAPVTVYDVEGRRMEGM